MHLHYQNTLNLTRPTSWPDRYCNIIYDLIQLYFMQMCTHESTTVWTHQGGAGPSPPPIVCMSVAWLEQLSRPQLGLNLSHGSVGWFSKH